MKKYFAKFLPVEGEIKPGDHGLTDTHKYVFKALAETMRLCVGRQKVELFLCSREISIGDMATELLNEGTYDKFEIHTENDIFPEMVKNGTQFVIMSKISEEALWVSEGDQFDEDDIAFFVSDSPPFEGDMAISREGFLKSTHWIKRIKIKGPCGHFH